MKQLSLPRIVVFALIGLILGGFLGEFLGWILGTLGELSGWVYNNHIRELFVHAFTFSIGFDNPEGWIIDLAILKFKLGFAFKINLASVLGLLIAVYIERWSRQN
jgi:hypothetical protein